MRIHLTRLRAGQELVKESIYRQACFPPLVSPVADSGHNAKYHPDYIMTCCAREYILKKSSTQKLDGTSLIPQPVRRSGRLISCL